MWFDLDKMADALRALNAVKEETPCDCGRHDGWHLWSCATVPQSLRETEARVKKARL